MSTGSLTQPECSPCILLHSQSHIDPCDAFKFRLYPAVMSVSCISLALTIGVYSALPELRNLPGKNVVCLSASLLLAFACLSGEMRMNRNMRISSSNPDIDSSRSIASLRSVHGTAAFLPLSRRAHVLQLRLHVRLDDRHGFRHLLHL